MNVTIDLKMLLLIIICAAVVVLVIYAVRFLKSVMVTLEHTNKVLEDVEVVTSIAASKSKEVDEIVSGVTESISGIAKKVSGKSNVITAVIDVIKAVASVKNAADDDKEKK